MKKYAWIFLTCGLAVNVWAAEEKKEEVKKLETPVKTEESPNLGLNGFGFGLGVFDGDFGIQGRKDFLLGPKKISELSFQGSLFFKDKTTFHLDADYHHVFTPNSSFRIYPLGGINLALRKKENRFGLNLGVGMNIKITDRNALFIEAKYIFGDWDGYGLIVGVEF